MKKIYNCPVYWPEKDIILSGIEYILDKDELFSYFCPLLDVYGKKGETAHAEVYYLDNISNNYLCGETRITFIGKEIKKEPLEEAYEEVKDELLFK